MNYDKFGRKVSAVTGKRLPTWNYLKYRRNKLVDELRQVERQLLEHNKEEMFELFIWRKSK